MIEKIDEYEIDLDRSNFNITNDAITLFNFMIEDDVSHGSILEIGPGSGYICLKLYKYNKDITAIEIQKEVFEVLEKNIRKNSLDIICLNEDVLKHDEKYDFIVTNPPYYKINSGKYPKSDIMKFSKFEFLLSQEALVRKIKLLLKDENSRFYMGYPIERKNELVANLDKNGLIIKKELEKSRLYFISGSLKK